MHHRLPSLPSRLVIRNSRQSLRRPHINLLILRLEQSQTPNLARAPRRIARRLGFPLTVGGLQRADLGGFFAVVEAPAE